MASTNTPRSFHSSSWAATLSQVRLGMSLFLYFYVNKYVHMLTWLFFLPPAMVSYLLILFCHTLSCLPLPECVSWGCFWQRFGLYNQLWGTTCCCFFFFFPRLIALFSWDKRKVVGGGKSEASLTAIKCLGASPNKITRKNQWCWSKPVCWFLTVSVAPLFRIITIFRDCLTKDEG